MNERAEQPGRAVATSVSHCGPRVTHLLPASCFKFDSQHSFLISMASSSSPPYAYVFSYRLPKSPFRKLDDENALSRLHIKYWNRSIDDEESTWASAHSAPMDTDESDIVRGCFPLQVNIPDFRIPNLWVREDYIRIYDYCDSHCKNRRGVSLWPCAIITGQPGSGECFSL